MLENTLIQSFINHFEKQQVKPDELDKVLVQLVHFQIADPRTALPIYTKVIQCAEKLMQKKTLATAYNGRGICNKNIGEFTLALADYKTSLNLFLEINDRLTGTQPLNNIGVLYDNIGAHDIALQYIKQAYDYSKNATDELNRLTKINNMASCMIQMGMYDEPVKYIAEGQAIYEKHKNRTDISPVHFNFLANLYITGGELYTYRNEPELALSLFHEAESIASRNANEHYSFWAKLLQGKLYAKTGDNSKAEVMYNLCRQLVSGLKDDALVPEYYFAHGSWMSNQPHLVMDAIDELKLALQYAVALNRKQKQMEIAAKFAEIYEKQNNLQAANFYIKQQLECQKALMAEAMDTRKQHLHLDYHMDAAKRELEKQETSIKLKQKFLEVMSHEMRTPLNSLIGFSELLVKTPMNEEQHNYMAAIKKSADQLMQLINKVVTVKEEGVEQVTIQRLRDSMHSEPEVGWQQKKELKSDSPVTALLVEDNKANMLLSRRVIERYMPQVGILEAENGAEALEIFKENKVDFILMDVNMPVMDGLEATKTIRNSFPDDKRHVPIIGCTAGVNQHELENCLSAGMNDYITKPFKHEEFVAKLKPYTMVSVFGNTK